MLTQIIVALIGPAAGAMFSYGLYVSKKNHEHLRGHISAITKTSFIIEKKVDDLSSDVLKNYVTNDDLKSHIKQEEIMHQYMRDDLTAIRDDVRVLTERIRYPDYNRDLGG